MHMSSNVLLCKFAVLLLHVNQLDIVTWSIVLNAVVSYADVETLI